MSKTQFTTKVKLNKNLTETEHVFNPNDDSSELSRVFDI